MTAATMLKRTNSQLKEVLKHKKEIEYYEKEYLAEGKPEHMVAAGQKWIEYHRRRIREIEAKIAEMSREAAKLATDEERKEMIKAKAKDMAERGFRNDGFTTNGLRYSIFWNNGITERSRHCYSMTIEGRGTVFTSGTLETVAEYILNN